MRHRQRSRCRIPALSRAEAHDDGEQANPSNVQQAMDHRSVRVRADRQSTSSGAPSTRACRRQLTLSKTGDRAPRIKDATTRLLNKGCLTHLGTSDSIASTISCGGVRGRNTRRGDGVGTPGNRCDTEGNGLGKSPGHQRINPSDPCLLIPGWAGQPPRVCESPLTS